MNPNSYLGLSLHKAMISLVFFFWYDKNVMAQCIPKFLLSFVSLRFFMCTTRMSWCMMSLLVGAANSRSPNEVFLPGTPEHATVSGRSYWPAWQILPAIVHLPGILVGCFHDAGMVPARTRLEGRKNMKKDRVYIDAAKFESKIRESGLPCEVKKGWMRVMAPAHRGYRLYVPLTRRVGRIDVACPVTEELAPLVHDLGGEAFGAVTHQLDFSPREQGVDSEAAILSAFDSFLVHLGSVEAPPPAEKKARARKEAGPKPTGWSQEIIEKSKPVSQLSGDEKAKRLALIAAEAARQGVQVSSKVDQAE